MPLGLIKRGRLRQLMQCNPLGRCLDQLAPARLISIPSWGKPLGSFGRRHGRHQGYAPVIQGLLRWAFTERCVTAVRLTVSVGCMYDASDWFAFVDGNDHTVINQQSTGSCTTHTISGLMSACPDSKRQVLWSCSLKDPSTVVNVDH